jgi:hypothetical protein
MLDPVFTALLYVVLQPIATGRVRNAKIVYIGINPMKEQIAIHANGKRTANEYALAAQIPPIFSALITASE